LAWCEGGARSHAKRSAPTVFQARTGFRRLLQLTASPHIRLDRPVRTHIPHACGEEAMRMRPIYKTAVCSAHGWHGHHPSRTGRGRRAAAPARSMRFMPSSQPAREPCGGEIAPQRHDQLARQGDNSDALGPFAGVGGARGEPPAERAVRLMPPPQPSEFNSLEAGARIACLADPLLAIDAAAAPWAWCQPAIAGDLAPIMEVLVEHLMGKRLLRRPGPIL